MSDILQPAFCQTPCYVQPGCQLYNEDCIETMQRISDNSIDLMITDPPYNTTACEWEYAIDLPKLWEQWNRIVKPTGVFIICASQPFTSEVVMSNKKNFKFEWIWDKVASSNYQLAKYQPLKVHENILVFSRGGYLYSPQKTKDKYIRKKPREAKHLHQSAKMTNLYESDDRHPTSIIQFIKDCLNRSNEERKLFKLHPTQKPENLFRYLINSFSNENDLVFDGYSGSATTAVACIKEKRRFIGSELSKEYFDKSVERLELLRSQPELF